MNLGLRYGLETPFTERYNRTSFGYNESARAPVTVPGLDLRGGLTFAGASGAPRRQGRVDGNNFGPRAGLAWQMNSKMVLRAGYGMFFSGQTVNSGFLGAVNAFNAVTPYVGTTDNATPFTTLANPFPTGLQQPLGSSLGLAAGLGDSIVSGMLAAYRRTTISGSCRSNGSCLPISWWTWRTSARML